MTNHQNKLEDPWDMSSGAAKSIVRIAQVVPQPVRTSGNFQEFTIQISYGQVNNNSGKKRTSKSKSDFAGPGVI